MNEKRAKKIKKIIAAGELSVPEKRLYRHCKHTFARLPKSEKAPFIAVLKAAIKR